MREYEAALSEALSRLYADQEAQDAAREIHCAAAPAHPALPTDVGGYGYRSTEAPNPDCPECDGLGVTYTHITDTWDLSPAARRLYDGTRQTQHGIEVKTQDRAAALERLAKHLGLFTAKVDAEETNPLAVNHDGSGRNRDLCT